MTSNLGSWSRRGAAAVALLLLSGCAPVDLAGTWVGTWRAALWADDGSMTLELTQDGDELGGTFGLTGTVCVGSGSIDGSVDGRQFDATLSNGIGGQIALDGQVNAASDQIEGDFVVTGGLCEDAQGTFRVSLQ